MAFMSTSNTKVISVYLDDGTYIRNEESVYIDEPIDGEAISRMLKSKNADNHMVFGWANVSVEKDGSVPLDWQGDVIPPDVLEKAAYNFVLKYRATGEQHQGDTVGYLVESIMFTKSKIEAMGLPEGSVPEGWWVGFYIPDEEVCAKIKDGTYKMFSIQGKAKRLKV